MNKLNAQFYLYYCFYPILYIMKSKISAWIHAFRLRTLPLSLSSIILASFIARANHAFYWSIAILAALTTLFLQILSNLANDYGDFSHGTDNENRIGPTRALQGGMLTKMEMKTMIIVFITLSLVFGIWLIYAGLGSILSPGFLAFFLLGVSSIAAAIKYTVGNNPYGYRALGDIYVLLFFGLIGVLGTYFLHSHTFEPTLILPAISVGLFSAGVLNLNNMRDRESDILVNKITLAVKLGPEGAKKYHMSMIVVGFASAAIYTLLHYTSPWQFAYFISLPFFIKHLLVVHRNQVPRDLDPQLKTLALNTFFFSILFGISSLL